MTITASRNGYGVSVRVEGVKLQESMKAKLEAMLRKDLDTHELYTKGHLSGAETKFSVK